MYSHAAVLICLGLIRHLVEGRTGELEFGYSKDPQDGSRIERSAVLSAMQRTWEGYRATTKLLKGAYPMITKVKRTTSYWKSGDYSTAMADFKGVNPSDVHDVAFSAGAVGKVGIVGDRIISLKHSPKFGWTRLTISKNSGIKKETTKEIQYVKVLTPGHVMPKY